MIITVSGEAGSGKSTLAKLIAEELNYERIYIGGIRRDLAKEKGMTLSEFNKWSENHSEGDVEVDQKVVEEAKKYENLVLEGRVMYNFFPDSVKIFVDVDVDEAAKRIFNDKQINPARVDEGDVDTIEDVKSLIISRKESDEKRYMKYYDLDVFNHDNYDFIINTTNKTIEESFKECMNYLKGLDINSQKS